MHSIGFEKPSDAEIKRNAIRTLIFSSPSEEAADKIVSRFSCLPGTGKKELAGKIAFLNEYFGIRKIGSCNPEGISEKEKLMIDYWAMLTAIISMAWR